MSRLPGALLINDSDGFICDSLLSGESKTNVESGIMVLDTKYYTARIHLISIENIKAAEYWDGYNEYNINATFYRFDGDFEKLDHFVRIMNLRKPETQAVVCESVDALGKDVEEKLESVCVDNKFDLIELFPSEDAMKDSEAFNELYGVPRIKQILESTEWPGREAKLYFMSEAKSAEFHESRKKETALFCGLAQRDEELILKFFMSDNIPNSKDYKDLDDPVLEGFFDAERKLLEEGLEKNARNVGLPEESDEFIETRLKKRKKKKSIRKDVSSKSTEDSQHLSRAETSFGKVEKDVQNGLCEVNILPKYDTEGESGSKPTNLPEAAKIQKTKQSTFRDGRELIDRLAESDSAIEQTENLAEKFLRVKHELEEMPFGPERQNKAADMMTEAMRSLDLAESVSGSDGWSDS